MLRRHLLAALPLMLTPGLASAADQGTRVRFPGAPVAVEGGFVARLEARRRGARVDELVLSLDRRERPGLGVLQPTPRWERDQPYIFTARHLARGIGEVRHARMEGGKTRLEIRVVGRPVVRRGSIRTLMLAVRVVDGGQE